MATSSPTKGTAPTPSSPSKILQQEAFKQSSSPPRTPHNQKPKSGRTKAAYQRPTIRPVLRETFLEDNTPEDAPKTQDDEYFPDEKDDLSFGPKHEARASMFDNMLQSLDQLSNVSQPTVAPSTAFNENVDIRSRYNTMNPTRRRGHTMSSSVSSENDVRKENIPPATYSTSRIGRSNSNSNFNSNSKKLPSIFGEDEPSTRTRVFLAQRAVHPAERAKPPQKRNGRASSKSSTSSSIDLGQMITSSQMRKRANRRSQSFDYGSNRHNLPSFAALGQLDAAPTPIVHAGPAARHIPLPPPPQPSTIVRKNSAKSSKSYYGRKDRAGTIGAASSKARIDESKYSQSKLEALPPLPTFTSSPALGSSTSDQRPLPLRERPGFFRRVFGSSKNAAAAEAVRQESLASQREGGASRQEDGRDMMESDHTATHPQRPERQNSKEPFMPLSRSVKATPPTVTKKSSAFFRRRKKSVTENVPVPVPLDLNNLKPDPGQPSPVSSLRQVMDPFLAEVRKSISSMNGTDELPQSYHTPLTSPSAVQDHFSAFEGGSRLPSEDLERRPRYDALLTLQIPSNAGLRVPANDRNFVSFLADSSSAELSTRSSDPSPVPPADRPRTTPTNIVPEGEQGTRPDLPSRNSSWHSERDRSPSPVVSTATHALSATLFDLTAKPSQLPRRSGSANDQHAVSPSHSLPIEPTPSSPHASNSELSVYRSAPSTPLGDQKDDKSALNTKSPPPVSVSPVAEDIPEDIVDSLVESENDREQALRIFDNSDDAIEPSMAAAWMGDEGSDRGRVRTAYMELFDWTSLNILAALRGLCDRIALKGESQQVDRLLASFARRWCDCNAHHGFKSSDVVHTICYSILLLNTDLHLANIGQKMTKGQFVKNALTTIKLVALDADTDGTDTIRAPSPANGPPPSRAEGRLDEAEGDHEDLPTITSRRPIDRLNREDSADVEPASNDIGPLVTAPFVGSERGWESQIENVLKAFFTSISKQRLPLFGAVGETEVSPQASSSFLNITGNMLRRTPSTMSKTHPENLRGRTPDFRSVAGRWTSKTRSRPRLYPGTIGSSRTSLDEGSSGWSPGMSSTWSKASLNKTLTSMSVDSFGSSMPRGDYQKSIGFASALSQAFMRDEQLDVDSVDESMRTDTLLEDESLGLHGAPWAKEGILKHKCHLDSMDKKSKDRNWNDCFAVIEKGWMRLFSFSVNAKSLRQKTKTQRSGGVVGGGNWQDNAEEIWKFLLRQTIASALPPPGYAKNRPYVWALSLPNGAVHLFQVGTPDIVKEFVSTANYWSARLSKEPMMGGVSNMEYGWSDAVINRALLEFEHQPNLPMANGRPSTQSSIRTSFDHGSVRPKLPGDKIYINDWRPPQQNTMASQLMEVDQLKALQTYVKNVEQELQIHN